MGHVLTYYSGITTVYSNVLIGQTENEANNFIKRTNIIHRVDNKNHPVSEIRVYEDIMEKTYCPTRLNVLVDQNRRIYELKDCG